MSDNQARKTRRFIDAVLKQSFRHLFGPTITPEQPPRHEVISIAPLCKALATYLSDADIKKIKSAFQFSDAAHLGQYRQSGEPYITHPVAVAELCANWRLDMHAIMAALLHDVMEDQGVTKAELAEKFGPKVAELVDGLSKLDRIEFRSREEEQAENFRKMMLAMARDVRVIIVKLADRLHNMRTLEAVSLEKRKRVARETLDIYAPIAHRLGLNSIYRELQDLSFQHYNPLRYHTLNKALKAARGNRREIVGKILYSVEEALKTARINATITGREKTVFSIYKKMRNKQLSFSQVFDVYGFRIVIDDLIQCYSCLGVLHNLFKPVPGKIKDYIAIPKVNGYQSLHTTLIGPLGTPVEFQIRTRAMHEIAESGIAAHWMYKGNGGSGKTISDAQALAHQWVKSLLEFQFDGYDSSEFLENLKVDLFPGSVYVFTPLAKIMALPRNSTALDFAYSVHSDLGNQCVAVRINNQLMPLRTELNSGDIVEVVTASYSKPNPNWLSFVRTAKARSTIRHYLKTMRFNESLQLGERLIGQSLKGFGINLADVDDSVWDRLSLWTGNQTRQEIFADVGLGRRYAAVMAKRIEMLMTGRDVEDVEILEVANTPANVPIEITGSEGMSVQFAICCRPIPGDNIMGYIGIGLGMAIHTSDCHIAHRIRQRDPGRWIDVNWAPAPNRVFDVAIKIVAKKTRGVFARVAADISALANIIQAAIGEDYSDQTISLRFTIQVANRTHLAHVFRKTRSNNDVLRTFRDRPQSDKKDEDNSSNSLTRFI